MKIAVGMSGGVDSAVAALLLKKEGHDVTGVTMKIWKGGKAGRESPGNACYGPGEADDIELLKKVCTAIGIEHHEMDCAEQFEKIVLENFRKEYLAGRTPNPCIRCNREIKFGALPNLAKEAGLRFDRFATGHYARTGFDTGRNRWLLMAGVDKCKDQSYFLYRLSQEQLGGVLFPLGALRKEQVRSIAKDAGLGVHDKEESQDFYAGDYADIIGRKAEPGDIVDGSGKVLGRHGGVWNFTVGQRKGLGIAYREPLYVLAIDAIRNRVVVGTGTATLRSVFTVVDCTWTAFERPDGAFSAEVKIRSAAPPAAGTVEMAGNNGVRVTFSEPHAGITPGQSAVFYDSDAVIGGGIIDEVRG